MWILFYIYFILTTIAIAPEVLLDSWWAPKEMVYCSGGLVFIASTLIFKNVKKIEYKNLWMAVLLMYCSIGFVWLFWRPLIFTYLNPRGMPLWNFWNFRPMINLVIGCFLIRTLVEYTDSIIRWVNIAKMLCWVGFIISIYGILQFLGVEHDYWGDFIQWHYVNRIVDRSIHIVTVFLNDFLTANFIAMISPMCLIFKQFRYRLMYIVMFICVCLTQSMLSIAAFIVAFLIYLFLSGKIKTSLVLSVLFVGTIFYGFLQAPAHPLKIFIGSSGRLGIWRESISIWLQSPYIGHGLGKFAIFQIYKPQALSAHNEVVQCLVELGILGTIPILGFIWDLLKDVLYTEKSMLIIGYLCGFIAFLIISTGGFPLRIAPLALVGIIYISGLSVLINQGRLI